MFLNLGGLINTMEVEGPSQYDSKTIDQDVKPQNERRQISGT